MHAGASLAAARPSWLSRQGTAFGLPFLSCCCIVYFAQGFRSLASLACQLFLKDTLQLEASTIQNLLAVSALPWSLKPLYGVVSDAYPICGLHRKPYLVVGAFLGVVAWVGLAGTASAGATDLTLLLVLLLCSNLSTALSDVIVDAMVAERCGEAAREEAANGGGGGGGGGEAASGTEGENALQTLCWGSLAVGGLLGSTIGMIASDAPPAIVFLLTATCPALVLLAAAALAERRAIDAAAPAGVGAQLQALWGALRLPAVWKPLLFFFLQNALVPSCGQATLSSRTRPNARFLTSAAPRAARR